MPATHFKPTTVSSSTCQSSVPAWRQQPQQFQQGQQDKHCQVQHQQQPQQSVAISGVAGRFPEALNIEKYAQCLFSQTERTQMVQDTEQFDAQIYGISTEVAHNMTLIQRQVTEQIYDCLVDAGVQLNQLRNSKTGLFVATNIMNNQQPRFNAQFYQTVFGFQGPVQMFEEQFSSSFFALDQARRAIQDTKCEQAVVCAVELTATGVPTVVSFFLQKRDQAKRFYAVLVQSQVLPSWETSQFQQLYKKWCVEPSLITYVETIGQRQQEQYRCLGQVYADNGKRTLPVMIAETETEQKYATGVQALIRMIIAIHTGVIPASQQRISQQVFTEQDVKMVKTNTKFFGGLMALNAFCQNNQCVNILVQPNTEYLLAKLGNDF